MSEPILNISSEIERKAFVRASNKASKVRAFAARNAALTFDQHHLIGLKSGE